MRRRFFQWLAGSIEAHRRTWVFGVLLLFAASILHLAGGNLGINSSRNGVVDDDDPEQQRLMAYNARFGTGFDIIAFVKGDDPARVRRVADDAAAALRELPDIEQVFYRVDIDAIAENGMYYLPTDHLEGMLRNLELLEASVRERGGGEATTVKGVPRVLTVLNDHIDDFVDGDTGGLGGVKPTAEDVSAAVGFFVGMIDELDAWLKDPERTRIGLSTSFAARETGLNLDGDGYLVADEGRLVLMRIRSRQDVADDRYAQPIRAAIEAVLADKVPGALEWGITGVPIMVAEEQGALKRDLPLTSLLSTLGCLLIFFVAFRSLRGTVVVFLPLAVGVAWAMAMTAVLVGSLNLVTSSFAVILIGMGIDFSVHVFTRVREERKDGLDGAEGTRRGLMGVGPAVLTGALTSAAAFAAMSVGDFRATRELGIIASSGLVLVMIATFLLLPIVLGRKEDLAAAPVRDRLAGPREWTWPSRATPSVLIGGLVVTLAFAFSIRVIDFNFDWMRYLPSDSGAIQTMRTLEGHGVGGIQYAVTQADSLAECRRQHERLVALTADETSVVARIESVFDVLPPDLPEKEPLVEQIRRAASKVKPLTFAAAPNESVATFVQDLDGLIERLRDDVPFALRNLGQGELARELEPITGAVERVRETAAGLDQTQLRARLDRFEDRFVVIADRVNGFFRRDHAPLSPADLPEQLVSAFYQPDTGDGARYATRVYPRGRAGEDPAVARRLRDTLREIDDEATGYAITQAHFGRLMRDGLVNAALWSSIVVLLLVILDLRRIRDVVLAFVPLVMGGVWMLGLMNVLDVEYGYANVVALPLIIGIGIDSGIHVIHRWRECDQDVGRAVLTTGKAILVSSLTTMCAFGSLMLASHGGARDLGFTLLLGVGACLITSLVFLPALLDLVTRRAARS